MNDVYYSVEPYTGDIICHAGVQGMAWGFAKGVANGLRKAVGKLDPRTGQYVYDQMKKVGNSYVGQRLKNDQLGSRTMANIIRGTKSLGNTIGTGIKSLGSNIGRKLYRTYDEISGNRKKREISMLKKRDEQTRKIKNDKTKYDKSLFGKINNTVKKIKTDIRDTSDNIKKAQKEAANSINNFIGNNITGKDNDYVGNFINNAKQGARNFVDATGKMKWKTSKRDSR